MLAQLSQDTLAKSSGFLLEPRLLFQVACALTLAACSWFVLQAHSRRRAWEKLLGRPTLTHEELLLFDGSYGAPVYIALAGSVFDVTSRAADFYCRGRAYHVYAGRESGRALGHMSLGKPVHAEHMDAPLVGDLDRKQRAVLRDWVTKFRERYPTVATLAGSSTSGGTSSSNATTTAAAAPGSAGPHQLPKWMSDIMQAEDDDNEAVGAPAAATTTASAEAATAAAAATPPASTDGAARRRATAAPEPGEL
jgi:predicted heme/steroid binding protein